MTDQIDLDPDAPHSPERTRDIADTTAEAMRTLNYATKQGSGGLEYPSDGAAVIGALMTTAARMEQSLRQLSQFVTNEHAASHVSAWGEGRHGTDVEEAVSTTCEALGQAVVTTQLLVQQLNDAFISADTLQGSNVDRSNGRLL